MKFSLIKMKLLLRSSLLAGLLASSASLSAPAQAGPCTYGTPALGGNGFANAANCNLTAADKSTSLFQTSNLFNGTGAKGWTSGDVFSWTYDPLTGIHKGLFNLANGGVMTTGTSSAGGVLSSVNFVVTIAPAAPGAIQKVFDTAKLTYTANGDYTKLSGTGLNEITTNGGVGTFVGNNTATNLSFVNAMVGSGLTLSNFKVELTQRDFAIDGPTPLPILGAGVAFGFSRKVRNRIKLAKASV